MENNRDFELTEEEQEFLHKMYEETFDFDKWADTIDEAIQNGVIDAEHPKGKESIELELDDLF